MSVTREKPSVCVISLCLVFLLSAPISALAQTRASPLAEANALIEKGRFQEALALIEKSAVPPNAQALFLRGLALSGLDRWAEAYQAFQKTLEIAPNIRPALRNAGIAAYNMDRLREAAD